MSAKEVQFGDDARGRLLSRRQHPVECRQGDLGTEGAQRRARQVLRRPHGDQGRRLCRQGDRTQGQVREHGRADGQGGRQQDLRRGRRRHHHGDRAGPVHACRGAEVRRCGHESHGLEARHRQGRVRGGRRDREDGDPLRGLHVHRPGRHGVGQQRHGDRRHHCRRDGQGRQGRRHHGRAGQRARERARGRRRHAVRSRLPVALLH